eukprot:CAMPEP_0197174950 /NCGR_PEP_ID=MMETSP1423-20130617/1304_1 /TAXON_ID=476441 /ORGANISM="Pseudo-nitzschia heimii, Strain UNC1101" /LENGTH=432 /DNA_ID=CAMNT_0042623983 /DNA_START=179 /DNA_END=1477 /DNA_ORIENTATION=-
MTPTRSHGRTPGEALKHRKALKSISLMAVAVAIGMTGESAPMSSVLAFLPQTVTRQSPLSRLRMAGFGSSAQQTSKKKKKGKNKKKGGSGGGGGETAAQAKQRWANKLKRVYGGTSSEDIAAGTEKRIASMKKIALDEPLRKALELQDAVLSFERRIIGMEAEDVRRRFSPEELERAIANRNAFDQHMEANRLGPEDIQIAMQRLTWDASADAKACRSVTGTMPATFKNRVTKASEMAYDAVSSDDGGDGLVLDVGCGYGVLVPFLKKAGFKAQQIHGVDLSSEMIGHAKTFYPDVARKGKFEALNFLEDETHSGNSSKYRSVVFCSALHDMPDLKAALLKTRDELLDTETVGSRLVIVHAQGASHVLNQNKQNSLLVPRGLPTAAELNEWLCGGPDTEGGGGPTMKLVHEPAEPKSQAEIREGYLAVLETI